MTKSTVKPWRWEDGFPNHSYIFGDDVPKYTSKVYVTKSSPLFFSFGNNVTAAAKRRLNLSPGVFQWQQMGSLYRGHLFASHNTGFL